MKKLVTVTLVVVFGLSSMSSWAQNFGVRASLGFSNLVVPEANENPLGRTFSFELGGTVDLDLADRFYLQSGLSLHKKGAATVSSGNFNLLYLEIPITARFDFVELGAEGSLYGRAGIYSGMLLSANFEGTKLSVGSTASDGFKFFDFGLISGLGYAINDSIDVGFILKFGFSDIEPNSSLVKIKNGAIMISANYRFGM